jgi:hypothetical protein
MSNLDGIQLIAGGGIDWHEYDMRCQSLESQGLTRSDAQAVVDAEMLQADATAARMAVAYIPHNTRG